MTTSQEYAERYAGFVPRESDRVRLPVSTEQIDSTSWLVWRGPQAVGEIHRTSDGQHEARPYRGEWHTYRGIHAAIASFGN